MIRSSCLLALLLTLVVPSLASAADAEASKPNILFLFIDDYGWRDLSIMGSDFYETPNLDRLASEGMLFSDAYACAANCAPSRACLLSGQYTPRHEIYNVGTGPRGNAAHRKLEYIPGTDTLRPDIKTWAQCLQEAGYVTATIGKWHLSQDPLPYGFDVNIGGTHSGSPPKGYFPPNNVPGLNEPTSKGEYLTDRLHDEAIKFIEANSERPWCLYLTHFAVHTPLQGKKELVAKYDEKEKGELHDHAVMAAMIESVDQGVGRVVETLEKLGLSDNTVIFFTGDNGGYGPATRMDPLKGYKGTYYEGGIRVPFFVKWPGVVAPNTTCDEPIANVDLYPTFLEIASAEKPDQPMDGVSLMPLLKGKGDFQRDALFWHFPAYLQSYSRVDGQRDLLFRSRPCSIIRSGDWKLHEYFEDGGLELYNLRDDIGESRNLVEEMPEKAAELHAKLRAWRAATDAPVPTKANPEYDAKAEAEAIAKIRSKQGL